ncbi:MAG TPA: YegP family protein [Candidatus Competibacteraceae bacterium]|nr:YegP family protein [Candidatus Competibacteraceae bacterium]
MALHQAPAFSGLTKNHNKRAYNDGCQFELKKTANGEFLFTLKAGNGETILTSERYQTKPGALNGIESVRQHATEVHRFEPREAANSQPDFVLKAAHGDIIGHREPYSAGPGLETRIASVQQQATVRVVDQPRHYPYLI